MDSPSRTKQIMEMRFEQGKTLQEIADSLEPKITRERVRQIISKNTPGGGTGAKLLHRAERISKPCKFCGKEIEGFKSIVEKRIFCNRKCYSDYCKANRKCRRCGTKENLTPYSSICQVCHNIDARKYLERYKLMPGYVEKLKKWNLRSYARTKKLLSLGREYLKEHPEIKM